MFAKMGKYEACGIFTTGHFVLATITIIAIYIALKYSVNKSREDVHNICICNGNIKNNLQYSTQFNI